mmetsp:Transcript_770/g.2312  ORF Transcript_770/g.2312 Transcript_770/m.2312 type:complete len:335 (+) Transcript_770:343-1347(+)
MRGRWYFRRKAHGPLETQETHSHKDGASGGGRGKHSGRSAHERDEDEANNDEARDDKIRKVVGPGQGEAAGRGAEVWVVGPVLTREGYAEEGLHEGGPEDACRVCREHALPHQLAALLWNGGLQGGRVEGLHAAVRGLAKAEELCRVGRGAELGARGVHVRAAHPRRLHAVHEAPELVVELLDFGASAGVLARVRGVEVGLEEGQIGGEEELVRVLAVARRQERARGAQEAHLHAAVRCEARVGPGLELCIHCAHGSRHVLELPVHGDEVADVVGCEDGRQVRGPHERAVSQVEVNGRAHTRGDLGPEREAAPHKHAPESSAVVDLERVHHPLH